MASIYIALLRGINVSGQKIIKMDHLRAVFEELQFRRVTTYIQSGNVIFEADESDAELLRERIERKLADVFGFEVKVVVRTDEELEASISNNPFHKTLDESLYVSYLSQKPADAAVEGLLAYKNDVDDYEVFGREVYILCRKGYGKSLFSNNFLEKKLGVSATTRNWESVNKINALSKSLGTQQ